MFSSQFWKWNAVDVANGENGFYNTRGIVVDTAETGLVVDFGITNREPELIAFDRIIQAGGPTDPKRECARGNNDCRKHEVLLQLSIAQPWTWYPAEILAEWASFGRVHFFAANIEVSDGYSIRDVVRSRHARYRAQLYYERSSIDFIKEHVDVPYDCVIRDVPLFRKLWIEDNYIAMTYPVGIVNGKFYYIQRRHDKFDLDIWTSILIGYIRNIVRESTMHNRGLKRTHDNSENEEIAISEVPYDVLHGVLSHLDTVQLVRYRRVCSLWDSVITSMDSTSVVINDMSTYENENYVLAAVLFKFIKKTTKYLIFTGPSTIDRRLTRSWSWIGESIQTTKIILEQAGVTVPTLVLADLKIRKSDLLEKNPSSRYCSNSPYCIPLSLRNFCQRLVLVRVTLLGLSEDVVHAGSSDRNLEIHYRSIKTANTTQWEVRDALEPFAQQFMKSVEKCDTERLSDWISKANVVVENGIPDLLTQTKIIQVLQEWEGDDRRFGPACAWKDVEAAQLSKLDRLHSITLMCLLHRMEKARSEKNFQGHH